MKKAFLKLYNDEKNSPIQYGSVISLQHLYEEKDYVYVEGINQTGPVFLRLDNPTDTNKYN